MKIFNTKRAAIAGLTTDEGVVRLGASVAG
jgi:hypothetical protein